LGEDGGVPWAPTAPAAPKEIADNRAKPSMSDDDGLPDFMKLLLRRTKNPAKIDIRKSVGICLACPAFQFRTMLRTPAVRPGIAAAIGYGFDPPPAATRRLIMSPFDFQLIGTVNTSVSGVT
jgi:hypothetical protein